MKGFVEKGPIEASHDFRRVLFAGKSLQLVQMALRRGEEIGEEVHEDRDQFFRVEEGEGEVVIDGVTQQDRAGQCDDRSSRRAARREEHRRQGAVVSRPLCPAGASGRLSRASPIAGVIVSARLYASYRPGP